VGRCVVMGRCGSGNHKDARSTDKKNFKGGVISVQPK